MSAAPQEQNIGAIAANKAGHMAGNFMISGSADRNADNVQFIELDKPHEIGELPGTGRIEAVVDPVLEINFTDSIAGLARASTEKARGIVLDIVKRDETYSGKLCPWRRHIGAGVAAGMAHPGSLTNTI